MQEDARDLGFGARLGQNTGSRFLNKDGSFNVRRKGLPFLQSLSLYHSFLTMSWTKFYSILVVGFVTFNVLFAGGYFLCGEGAFYEATSTSTSERIFEAFFFSIQTSTTIGYGHIAPMAMAANILVAIEAMISLLGLALATGFLFARFSTPDAKILFSNKAIITSFRGGTAFMFRIANQRSNQLIQVGARVLLSVMEDVGGKQVRRYHELTLERHEVIFFPLHWTIVHPIDGKSPLAGATTESLTRADAEIMILLNAIDETFSASVHARSSYKPHEIVFGGRFRDMFVRKEDEIVGIDMRLLHDIEMVDNAPA